MEKHIWNRVETSPKSQSLPIPRWGHSCCVIGEEVIFFGGYADSNYMNDLWSFNSSIMQWKEIKTSGEVPANRSNCSMNYDAQNNRIVVFGGGGPNKKRFNSISILNWSTKEWIEIQPKENEAAPWERTYHSAEMVYPYLVVFGGEGVADLDDLWVFNFLTLSWTEVPASKQKNRPCARRFHSSVVVDNQFFVIAGCHAKYKPLNDIYSLDLSPLIQNGRIDLLEWKERKIKGSAFLSRWGQTSSVFDRKIYIFGGRFSNDLNDVLVIDLQKQVMKTLKTGTQMPKSRRRHCGCFLGSSLLIFGGFNGQYFNDMHYINVFELKSKLGMSNISSSLERVLDNSQHSDFTLITTDDQKMHISKGLIYHCFKSRELMDAFLFQIDCSYSYETMRDIFSVLYRGWGLLPVDQGLIDRYDILLPETEQEMNERQLMKIMGPSYQPLRKGGQNLPVLLLQEKSLNVFLERQREVEFADIQLQVNNYYKISLNSAKLINNSYFFQVLLTGQFNQRVAGGFGADEYQHKRIVPFIYPLMNPHILQVLVNYLQTGYIVVCQNVNEYCWMQLAELARYLCVEKVLRICEQQLCQRVNMNNLRNIFQFAVQYSLNTLAQWCSQIHIKASIDQQGSLQILKSSQGAHSQAMVDAQNQFLAKVYQQLRFDTAQMILKRSQVGDLKKVNSCSTQGQKQNHECNDNY